MRLLTADMVTIAGYFITSFVVGYAAGLIQLWFKKLGESL